MIVPMMLAAIAPEEASLWEMVPVVEMAEPCPLPAASWGKREPAGKEDRWIISVIFDGDELSWDGLSVDEQKLRARARAVRQYRSNPRIYFYSTKDCAETRRIAALIASEANCTPRDCIVSPGPLRAVLVAPPSPPSIPTTVYAPVAPPAPPAPSLPPPSVRAAPRGAPQSWITNDDYPARALRLGEQGTTAFRLDLDTAGIPQHCTVTSSSGSQTLDDKACELLMARAMFTPAQDKNGRPMASTWSSRMRWELPEGTVPIPPTQRLSWTNIVQFTIGVDGRISGCTDEQFGESGLPKENACDFSETLTPENRVQMRGKSVRPVTFIYRYEHNVSGVPMNPVPKMPARFHPVATLRVTFEIDETGEVSKCLAELSPVPPPGAPSPCEAMTTEVYAAGPRPSMVTIARSMLTTGDTDVLPKPEGASE